jgi:potassium-dependent mechanosensitive channel
MSRAAATGSNDGQGPWQTARRLLLWVWLAAQSTMGLTQPADVVADVAAENARLASLVMAERVALDRDHAERAQLQLSRERFEQRLQRIDRHAELAAVGRELAVLVRTELRTLPRPEEVAAGTGRRALSLEAASDASVRAGNAALALSDLDAAVARRLAAIPAAAASGQREPLEAAVRERLAEQRDLLEQLNGLALQRLQTLRAIDRAEADSVQRGAAARKDLTRLLFWLPSPPEWRMISDLAPSLAWLASGAHWHEAGATLADGMRREPAYVALALLVASGLLIGRSRLRRRLAALVLHAAIDVSARVADALKSIAVTLALALPLPLLLWSAGRLLSVAPATQPFTLDLAEALLGVARLLFALSACAWLLEPHGLAIGHLGWDPTAVGHARRSLRRYIAAFVPLTFLAALNVLDGAPYANRETLGRLLFCAAMVVLAIALVRLFRRSSPLMRLLCAREPRGWAMRFYPVWYGALLAFPAGMLVLAAAGYLTAAAFFFGHTTSTLFLLLAAGALYGLVALWVQVQRWQLEQRRQAQAGTPSQSIAADASGGERVPVLPPKIDLALIGEQTRSLLDVTLTVVLLAGLWWIWKDALPALSTIGDAALWSFPADDRQPAFAVTVSDLFLALVTVAVTAVAVRNVGALLDIVLLQRLEFQADANYAIKVLARYAITAVGIVLACRTLGISWSTVHWLVAALGVGLGFGLQEIVANFVSGLIVLAERPVRIGDVVTIGNVTGTVWRIRARATVVIDADNREVIVPNKGFITERVVNWTLSDTTTRLLLTFRVAYGSDVAEVQRLVLGAVRSTPDVMSEPAPSVFFVDFGELALNFEVRAFVRSLDDTLRVRHAINSSIDQVLRANGIRFPA